MRFTSNVIYAWESGLRAPTASAFFKLALSIGADPGPALQAALLGPRRTVLSGKRLATPDGVAELLRELAQDMPVASLARTLGVDRSTMTRWLRGKSEPRLPELLRFIDATALRLLDVLEQLTDPALLPTVKKRHRNLKAQRQLAFELPVSQAVLRTLELDAYRQGRVDDATFVASRIGISREEAATVLRALARAGQIRRQRGRYRIVDVMTVDTRGDVSRDVALKRHWAQLAVDRIEAERLSRGALASYNVLAASNEAYERIRKLHLDYYDEVRRIVAADTRADRVVLLNLGLLPLDL